MTDRYNWADVEQLHQNGVFCPDGWTGVSSTTVGQWRLCCYTSPVGGTISDTGIMEHLNHPDRKAVRKAMMLGDKEYLEKICTKCHYQQDNGLLSRRERVMMKHRGSEQAQSGMVRVLNSMTDDYGIDPTYVDMLDIKFIGNQCNLKCFTCKPQNSSALGVEARAMGDLPMDYKPVQIPLGEVTTEMTEKFWNDFRQILPHLRIINFTGGEPFMMNSYWDMIDEAIKSGFAENMELHLSSNVSMIKWDRGSIMDCFAAFKSVRLQASIDGFGLYNDYIRYPSKYVELVDNIEKVRDEHPTVDIAVSSVISALSVSTMPLLGDDMKQRGFNFVHSNVLSSPVYQMVEWLPMDVKADYKDRYIGNGWDQQYPDVMALLDKPEDMKRHKSLIDRCRALDKFRDTSADLLWPEFHW